VFRRTPWRIEAGIAEAVSASAASIVAALTAERMCGVAWAWGLVQLQSGQRWQPQFITTERHADISPTRPAIEFAPARRKRSRLLLLGLIQKYEYPQSAGRPFQVSNFAQTPRGERSHILISRACPSGMSCFERAGDMDVAP
jgi:hypothetical protein